MGYEERFEKVEAAFPFVTGGQAYQYPEQNLLLVECEDVTLPAEFSFAWQYVLFVKKGKEDWEFFFQSDNYQVRALEFLKYILTDAALVKEGKTKKEATGIISSVMLHVAVSANEMADELSYIMSRIMAYFDSCDVIWAKDFAGTHEEEIASYAHYVKRHSGWSYVKSLAIAPEGTEVLLKTFENESGARIKTGKDVYIMIGCRGEVYDISREKFERTYEATEEPLDVFEQMLDYIPAVEILPEHTYISLDELARICYPVQGSGILVKQLEKRTKVFPVGEESAYFLGKAGDYLAVRPDDRTDLYIIKSDVFEQTYELAE